MRLTLGTYYSKLHALRHKSLIRIVLSKPQSELGPAGKHTIGFCGAEVDQVVNHNPNVSSFVSFGFPRRDTHRFDCVDTREQTWAPASS